MRCGQQHLARGRHDWSRHDQRWRTGAGRGGCLGSLCSSPETHQADLVELRATAAAYHGIVRIGGTRMDRVICVMLVGAHFVAWLPLRAQELELRHTIHNKASGGISCAAISPDGTTLAVGSYHRFVEIWDLGKRERRLSFGANVAQTSCLAFSPDGKVLALGSWGSGIRVWNAHTGEKIGDFQHSFETDCLAFSPDGKMLACPAEYSTVKVWDLVNHKLCRVFRGHTRRVSSLVFGRDGKTLVSGSVDKTVKFWDLATWRDTTTLEAHDEVVRPLALSPDGRTLASGSDDRAIRLWDIPTSKSIAILEWHDERITSLAFSPDGRTLASASTDETIRLWDAASGANSATVTVAQPCFVGFGSGGRALFSASFDGSIKFWDVKGVPNTEKARSDRVPPNNRTYRQQVEEAVAAIQKLEGRVYSDEEASFTA